MNAIKRALAAMALLLVVLSFWPRESKRPDEQPATVSAPVGAGSKPNLLSVEALRSSPAPQTAPTDTEDSAASVVALAAATDDRTGDPHQRLEDWVERYFAGAWAGDQGALLAEGEELARRRREHLASEIEANPRAALERTVPYRWREVLPVRVTRHFEDVVSGRGDYQVYMASPVPGADHTHACGSAYRYVTLGGRTYRAHVYGARMSQMSQQAVPLQGIAVDDLLALHEEPARVLDADESRAVLASGAAVAGACAMCGETAGANARVVDVAGALVSVCGPSDAARLNRALMGIDLKGAGAMTFGLPAWTNAPPKPVLATHGVRRALYMRLVFRDDTTIPISEAQAAAEMDQVSDFYIEASYSKTAILTTVTPIITLPKPKARYSKDGPGSLMADALGEAAKAGYAQENYELLLARFTPVPGYNWGGLGGGRNAWLQYNGAGLAIHEIGHCYGLGHANYWETRRAPLPTPPPDRWDTDSVIGHDSMIGAGDDIEYGDIFDVMGSGGGEYQGSTGSGGNQPLSGFTGHFNPVGKWLLGWLPDSVIPQATENQTNRVYVFDTPVLVENRAYALKIRKDEQRTYWLSARSKIQGNQWISNGLSLHWGAWPQIIGYSTLIDTTPGSRGGRDDSAIVLGRTFTDPEIGLYVTPVAKGGSGSETYFDLVVNRGPFPDNGAPEVTLVATNRVAAGRPVTFTVNAVDPDGDTLAYYWEISDGTLGSNGPSLTRTWQTQGDYRVRVEVSDMRGHVVSQHVVVQVGARDSFRISGTVTDNFGAPMAGVRVANGALTNTTDLSDDFQVTLTDSEGAFTLINQSPGDRAVTAFLHGYRSAPQNFNTIVTVADQDVSGLEFLASEQPRVTVRVANHADQVRGTPGQFTFTRTGDTNTALRAVFTLAGTAKEGTDFATYTNTTTHTNTLQTLLNPNVNLPVPFSVIDFQTGVFQTNVTIVAATNPAAVDEKLLSASVMYALQKETTYQTNVDDGNGGQTNGLATNYTFFTGWEVVNFNAEDTWFQTYGDYVVGNPGEARMLFKAAVATSPVISLVAVGRAVSENGGDSILLLLTRTGKTNVDVNVRLRFAGTATYGQDYAPVPDLIRIASGVTSVPLPVYVYPDLYLEGNETVSVEIVDDPAYKTGSRKAEFSIGDNDLPTVTVAASDPVASETGNDTGAVVFTRIGDLTRDLTVSYLAGGSAISGQDYRALPGTIVIPAGQPSATLIIQPRDNRLNDGGQTVEIILSDSPLYNVGVPGTGIVFIQDGARPTVSIRASSPDGAEPGTPGEFTLWRVGDNRSELLVNLAVGGTARPVADYAPITGLGRIPAGATSVVVRVSPVNDTIREDTETVICEIVPGTNYNLSAQIQAAVTINDDDSGLLGVGFTFLGTTVYEGAKTGLVAVSVSANPNDDVTVDWKVTGGTAVPGLDYPATNASGRLLFTNVPDPAISNRVELIAFPILDDTNAEPDKTIVLSLVEPAPLVSNEVVTNEVILTNAAGEQIGTTNILITNVIITPVPLNAVLEAYRSHTISLLDDDSSVVSLVLSEAKAREQERKQGLVTVQRVGATNRAQVVKLSVTGSASNGSDYETIPGTVVIPEGETILELPVIPVDDPMQEFLEDVRLAIIEAPGATRAAPEPVVVTIEDNDGTVEFQSPAYTAFESVGEAGIAVRRTSDTNGSATVAYRAVAGTATTNDFVATNGVVTFAPGEIEKTFSIPLLDDRLVESSETVQLTLRNLSDGVPLGGQVEATLTILDDDTVLELLAPATTAIENDGTAGVLVYRYGIITNTLRVELATTTNGTAVEGLDFVLTNYPVVFQPGQTTAVAQVKVLDDELFDADKIIGLSLTNLDAVATLGTNIDGTITVLDDECALQLTATGYVVDEYVRTVQIAVERTGSTIHPVLVSYATQDGSAQAGKDYVTARGDLNFAGAEIVRAQDGTGVSVLQPGETNAVITVRILDDRLGEGDEVFYVGLTNARPLVALGLPGTVILGAQTNASVLIVDNETPGSVDFEFNPGLGANDTVHTLALQPDAKVVLGGAFTEFDSVSLNRIARIHDDAYLDTFLNPGEGFNDTVHALALQADGRILAGGAFTRLHTTAINRLARLNADGAVDPEFRVGTGADGLVRALAVEAGGTLLVGGEFNNVSSVPRPRLARLLSNGSVDTTFTPAVDGAVRAIVVDTEGRILIGGAFTTAAGVSRPYLARLNTDGTADASFNPGGGPDGRVDALALQPDGRILLAGVFKTVAGASRSGLARVNADGSLDSGFAPGTGADGAVHAVGLAADGKVLIGGSFTSYNGEARNRIARLNPDGSLDTIFDVGIGANDAVRTLVVQPDSAVVIGGDFTQVNKVPRNRIARLHGDERFRLNVLQFSASAYRVQENAGEATITVLRAGDTTVSAAVDYLAADGTAVAGQDYQSAGGTLQFAAGETQKTFPVRILDDTLGEGDLTLQLLLTNLPPGFSLTARLHATLTIEDDEGAVAFSAAAYMARESDGTAAVTVRRTGPTNTLVSVDYATADGTALAGRDYQPASGTLTFAEGVTEQAFNVALLDDSEPGTDLDVLLTLANPQGSAVLGRLNAATLTIQDDDRVESYALNVSPPVGGSVTPPSGLYPAGSTQAVTAVPARGFGFVGWEGTVTSAANPLFLVMNQNHVLTARFLPLAYTYTFEPPFGPADLAQPPWNNASTLAWQVQSVTASGGRFAIRSGVTPDGGESLTSLLVDSRGGAASFDVRVSCEANWDFAEFYVDGLRVERWTGDLPWRTYVFNLGPGTHTLTWRYAKDSNFSGGLDAMFVDNIFVPVEGVDPTDPAASLRLVSVPGGLQLWITGKVGLVYTVEQSDNLATWTTLSSHTNTDGTIVVPLTVDPAAGAKYYRAVTAP